MKNTVISACLSALGLSLFSITPVYAQGTAKKESAARSIDVKKIFGYYDMYLRLPPQDRDGFRLGYRMMSRGASAAPQLNYLLGSTRTPIQIAPNGKILTMPDMNMFQNGKVEIAAGQPSGSVSLDLEAIVPLSRSISVAEASNPINDYAAAIRRSGPLALLAPRLNAIVFKGGAGGQAVFADGRRVALPAEAGGVRFQPSAPTMRGVVSLAFTTPPTEAEFAK